MNSICSTWDWAISVCCLCHVRTLQTKLLHKLTFNRQFQCVNIHDVFDIRSLHKRAEPFLPFYHNIIICQKIYIFTFFQNLWLKTPTIFYIMSVYHKKNVTKIDVQLSISQHSKSVMKCYTGSSFVTAIKELQKCVTVLSHYHYILKNQYICFVFKLFCIFIQTADTK